MACSHLIRSLIYRSALVSLFTAAAFAQTQRVPKEFFKAPPEVEQALRTRVTEFFQLHVESNFRKAWSYVAEDTQEYYFNSQKNTYEAFKITGMKFWNSDFTKASVDLECQQKMTRIQFRGVVVPIPMTTLWKVENGQWMWYRDPDNEELTPMGLSDLPQVRQGTKAAQDLKKLTSPEEIERRGKEILKNGGGVDKQEVTLAPDRPSTAQVIYHNAQPGYVKLVLDPGTALAGFTATLDKVDVDANQDGVVKISYAPPSGAVQPHLPAEIQMRLFVQPFNQVYSVKVKFGIPGANH